MIPGLEPAEAASMTAATLLGEMSGAFSRGGARVERAVAKDAFRMLATVRIMQPVQADTPQSVADSGSDGFTYLWMDFSPADASHGGHDLGSLDAGGE